MCNLHNERAKIEKILREALASLPRHAEVDIFQACYAALAEAYDLQCPDECIKKKCAEFLERHHKAIYGEPKAIPCFVGGNFVCGW